MKLATVDGVDDVDGSDATFGAPFNESLVHQVVVAYMAGGRAGTKAQKSRADVRGGGRKPWRQKGTGRARAGTIRSPLWQGGGKTFAARPRSYAQKVNRKMYRGAMRSIFSELQRQDRLVVVPEFQLEAPRTKTLIDMLDGFGRGRRGLVVTASHDQNLELSARNLPHIDVTTVSALGAPQLVGADCVFVTGDAIKQIEGWLG